MKLIYTLIIIMFASNSVRTEDMNDQNHKFFFKNALKIQKDNTEWKKILTPFQYFVTRKKGTEKPFTGKYWNHKEKGVYQCICCGNDLFHSGSKFQSDTGWPSFDKPVNEENIRYEEDNSFMMKRIEILCNICDAHLGHVFEDGTKSTGKRYCINSTSLNFKKPVENEYRKACFAGGCFWCMQPAFDQLYGIISTQVGYMGGGGD